MSEPKVSESVPEWVEKLAIEHKLRHFVQGDDGFGGEYEADPRAIEAILAAIARQRELDMKAQCEDCRCGKDAFQNHVTKTWYHVDTFNGKRLRCAASAIRNTEGE